ncbi:head decoration protein [Profundibacter sp.]|uniref:head decoration protein n=1 Tax=Profundibacter sp. TaxID=3101071 RepID=UPI003D0B5810
MTTLTETTHPGGFLVWEAFRDYTREVVTIATGGATPVLEPGTVLGKITASGKYAAHDPAAVDVDAVVLLRGPAIVNGNDLVFAGTPTALEIAAAHTALAAVGILTR